MAAQNGYCQDGGVGDYGGAIGGFCEWGTDCEDCIPRDHPSPPVAAGVAAVAAAAAVAARAAPAAPRLRRRVPLVASGHCEDGGPGSIQG